MGVDPSKDLAEARFFEDLVGLAPGVLALRGYLCHASDRTLLFDLCLFGAGSELRGYEVGRYRDQAMVAAQAEYRLRWLAAEKARVNLSVDIARARDSTSLYVYVKESF
jgi:hypothetical protein